MTDETYERVVREHKDRVFSRAVWLLRDREEARDVAQDALVRLWKHRDEVDEPGAKAWLLTTAHRLGLDRHRRNAVRAVSDTPAEEASGPDPDPGPEQRAAWTSVGGVLEKALGRLSERDRAAVLLREVEGYACIVELDGSAATENRAAKMISEIIDSLERSGWERLVKVRDKSETVNVYVRNGETTIDRLVVLVFNRDGKEVVFAILVGSIDLARLGDLDGTLVIPGLDVLDDAGARSPAQPGATPAPKPGQNKPSAVAQAHRDSGRFPPEIGRPWPAITPCEGGWGSRERLSGRRTGR